LEYDVLIDAHIFQESRWKEIGEAGYRFYKNVMDEGGRWFQRVDPHAWGRFFCKEDGQRVRGRKL
jgi:hypothetical protein